MTERDFAVEVVKQLRNAGHEALWAGGCVRDELLDLVAKDYDVATSARPEQVRRVFRRTVEVGMSFGVVKVLGPRTDSGFLEVEVATFRTDAGYSDGRHPDSVVFSSAREDALRRDFTINGMFFDPIEGKLLDYVGGREDLEAKILRAIGDATTRFGEDKLRLIRAVRFATRFDLVLEPATESALKLMAPQITVVSAERIADELRKTLALPARTRGIRLLDTTGLLKAVVPEVLELKNHSLVAPEAPSCTHWEHTLRVLDLIGPDPSFPLALAALLHDGGKPIGSRMAGDACSRLKLSNAETDKTVWLVENCRSLIEAARIPLSKLKKLLAHPGIRELLTLHRAEALATGRSTDHVEFCENLLKEWTPTDLNPPPLLTGNDLVQHGLEPGPLFKRLLDAVRDAQLDGTITTPEEALALVDRRVRESGRG